MGKYILTILLGILASSCNSKPVPPKVCVVAELKEISRGESNPDLYVITKEREALDFSMDPEHFVRLKVGDSIKIYYTDLYFVDHIEFLK